MKNLMKLVDELQTRDFQVNDYAKGKAIHQPQRNALRAELLNAIFEDIKATGYEFIYPSDEGLLLEIANDNVADNVDPNGDGSGAITVLINATVKGLDFDAQIASESYESKLQAKADKKKADEEKKQRKIAQDSIDREKRKAAKKQIEG